MFLPLNSGSNVRLLVKITGDQEGKTQESKTAGGIILAGGAEKEKSAEYGKTCEVVQVSDHDSTPICVGDEVIVSKRSGRSAIRENGETLYIINQDEVWAYKQKGKPCKI